jgi:hypothetical protein
MQAQTSMGSAHELAQCRQIRKLEIPGYAGSMGFLAGWPNLEELDLRDSGALTDLEVLAELTTLKAIRIRGATVKKDAWPAQLRDVLVTR